MDHLGGFNSPGSDIQADEVGLFAQHHGVTLFLEYLAFFGQIKTQGQDDLALGFHTAGQPSLDSRQGDGRDFGHSRQFGFAE